MEYTKPNPTALKPIDPIIVMLAEKIRRNPLFNPRDKPVLGDREFVNSYQDANGHWRGGKFVEAVSRHTFLGGVMKGTNEAFSLRLPNSQEREIALLRQAMAQAPKYRTEAQQRDDAFDAMVAEHAAL